MIASIIFLQNSIFTILLRNYPLKATFVIGNKVGELEDFKDLLWVSE